MKKIASAELKEFLQDWLDWAEGRVSKIIYDERFGLCSSLIEYGSLGVQELYELMDRDVVPFGCDNYFERKYAGTQHQDPNRLSWVKAALNDTLDTWELAQ